MTLNDFAMIYVIKVSDVDIPL